MPSSEISYYKDYYRQDDEDKGRKRVKFFQDAQDMSDDVLLEDVAQTNATVSHDSSALSFRENLEAVVGTLEPSLAIELEEASDGDIQRAINMFFDISQKTTIAPSSIQDDLISNNLDIHDDPNDNISRQIDNVNQASKRTAESESAPLEQDVEDEENINHHVREPIAQAVSRSTSSSTSPPPPPRPSWHRRYIGSFQAEVWATRSGNKLVQYGDKLKVQRLPPAAAPSNYGSVHHSKEDFIVRIFNSKGQDFARLSESDARIVSLLIDTEVCEFTATCIYADSFVRIGSYVVIQVECHILRRAFYKDLVLPQTATRALGRKYLTGGRVPSITMFDNSRENGDERIMRLRQTALVGLFNKLGFTSNDEDLAAATEVTDEDAESISNNTSDLVKATQLMGAPVPDTPGASSGDEEGNDVNQDDLDNLYKRTEPPDTHLDELEPASTLAFTLRPYQKKGLNWMIQKETPTSTPTLSQQQRQHLSQENDDNPDNEPMHPLWQSIDWPEIPNSQIESALDHRQIYSNSSCFYANLYAGELSLKFPVQKKTVRGGILADEMGLGKTISTMALIHSSQDEITSTTNTTTNYAPNTTLVVAPMSLLSQWESEALDSSKKGTVEVLVYYGSSTNELTNFIKEKNSITPKIIITSYGTLVSEHNGLVKFRQMNGYDVNDESWQQSPDLVFFGLYNYIFHRVVLDEGHTIKNRNTKTAKACYDLRSEKRWVLTGTPIVNKLEDLYSIVKFLGVEPWNNFAFWKAFITVPFQSKGYVKALNVVQSVMEPLVLRRTKSMKQANGQPLIELPPKTVTIERIKFSEDEQVLYSWIFARAKSSFDKRLEQGSVMKSYSAILSQILRLRQTCCHPSLVWSKLQGQDIDDLEEPVLSVNDKDGSVSNDIFDLQDKNLKDILERLRPLSPTGATDNEILPQSYGVEVMKSILEDADKECSICTTDPIPEHQLAVTECWHVACLDCILEHINFQKKKGEVPRCPTCRVTINADRIFQVHRNGKDFATLKLYRSDSGQSAKMRALLTSLRHDQGLNTKSVVFSQFTSFLDLIQAELKLHGIQTLRFDGTLSQKARGEVLTQFREDPNKKVMLISLKAGGVGLNLVCAQNAYMMDPWWSYSVESQAIDRIHRMGQTSEVKVIRYIIEGTVEERMLKIQDRKKFLASTLGMSEEEKKAQRLEDIKMLFE